MTRTEKLNTAVTQAAHLIGMLSEFGEVTTKQATVLMMAAAKGAVGNPQDYEVRSAAWRVLDELEKARASMALSQPKKGT